MLQCLQLTLTMQNSSASSIFFHRVQLVVSHGPCAVYSDRHSPVPRQLHTTHDLKCRTVYTVSGLLVYGSSDSTKSPASGIATVHESRLMSQVGKVRKVACA